MKPIRLLQADVVSNDSQPNTLVVKGESLTYYNEVNTPITLSGHSELTVNWSDITNKPITFTPTIGTTATTAKAGNYAPSATEVVTALKAMTPEQITEIQTLLGITTT